ncbi:hypothetical protein [Paraburkholderia sp. RL17-373-BIF-A]|uniref:hypothetical protein n=1 Tax=Paraburkholderia sp. RL17-373-BIF-A TaxID=3031629 RepID=UPI0038B9C115
MKAFHAIVSLTARTLDRSTTSSCGADMCEAGGINRYGNNVEASQWLYPEKNRPAAPAGSFRTVSTIPREFKVLVSLSDSFQQAHQQKVGISPQ